MHDFRIHAVRQVVTPINRITLHILLPVGMAVHAKCSRYKIVEKDSLS